MKYCQQKPLQNVPWFIAAVLCVALAIPSCSERQKPLPGGFFIFYASDSEIFLNEPKYGGSIPELGRDLKEIGHHNEFIFGRSGAQRGAPPGYFLLNTKNGSIKAGLTESNWLSLTAEAGIPNPPKLLNPARQIPIKR